MALSTVNSDVYVGGNFSAKSMSIPASSVGDANVVALAGIQASKVIHQYEPVYRQPSGNNAATETQTIHVVNGATATLIGFSAGSVVAATGNDTVTVDLRKNGSTILTSVITLNNANTARVLAAAAGYTSTSLVAGDWLEVVVTATHNTGTLPQGVAARVVLSEAPQ